MKTLLSRLCVASVIALAFVAVDAAKAEMVGSLEPVGPRGRQMVYRHVNPAKPYALTGEGRKESASQMKLVRQADTGVHRDRTASYRWVEAN